jgi:adenylate cyclase, class 2
MEMAAVRNIEVKARAPRGLQPLRAGLRRLGAEPQWIRQQVDTFFATPRGRLKLRESTEAGRLVGAELIPYLRPDESALRQSRFVVLPVARPDVLAEVLGEMLGRRLVVRKTRELWLLHGDTVRVHLDLVEGLGEFVEIEAVVETEQGPADGSDDAEAFARVQRRRAEGILAELGLSLEDLVAAAYADLLAAGRG